MREILFRGKRTDNGVWVEGYLIQSTQCYGKADPHTFIVNNEHPQCCFGRDIYIEVIPETVGQYTGLTDKNGKKIFEHDIVKTQPFTDRPNSNKAKSKEHVGVVEYKVFNFHNSQFQQDYNAKWIVNVKDYGKFGCYVWSEFFRCEVIGNIHDNPEYNPELIRDGDSA